MHICLKLTCDFVPSDLECRRGAREVILRPDGPIAYALVRLQFCIRPANQCANVDRGILQYQHGVDIIRSNHGASTYFHKSIKHSLDVLGVNVESFRCGDDIFLAAAEVKPAVGVNLAEVARMKP